MNINDAFPSKYIKADDLQGQRIQVTVMAVTMEDIGDKEFKPAMRFVGREKALILNKTNSMLCAQVWGDQTDHWSGQQVELFAHMVNYQGRMVPGLALAPMLQAGQTMPAQQPGPVGASRQEMLAQRYDQQAQFQRTNDEITQAQFQQPGPHDVRPPYVPPFGDAQATQGARPAQHPIPPSNPVAPQQQAVQDAVDAGQAKHAVDPNGNLDDIPFN